jgi:hypothetical protein
LETHDFDDTGEILDSYLSGSPNKPWKYDGGSACLGSSKGLRAEDVDFETIVSVTAPPGTRSMTFMYGFERREDSPATYTYEVIVDGTSNVIVSGPSDPGAGTEKVDCASDCLYVSEEDVVQFRCFSDATEEKCRLDHVQFWGNPQLLTTFASTNGGSNGDVFTIQTEGQDLEITGFPEIHAQNAGTNGRVRVWARENDYGGFENNPAGWTLIQDVSGISTGPSTGVGYRTSLPSLATPYWIEKGKKHSFHINFSYNVMYTAGVSEGNVFTCENNPGHIIFYEGRGCDSEFNCPHEPRIWNGIIAYTLLGGARKLAGAMDNQRPTLLSMAIASAPTLPPMKAQVSEPIGVVPSARRPSEFRSKAPTPKPVSQTITDNVRNAPSLEPMPSSLTESRRSTHRGSPHSFRAIIPSAVSSYEPTKDRSRSPSATVHSRLPSYMPSDWPTVPIRPSEYTSNPKTSSSKAPMPKVRRKLANGSNSGGATSLGPAINAGSSPPTPGTRRRNNNPTRRPNYSFSAASSRPICNKETVEVSLGQADHICPEDDLSSGKFNCCENAGDYSCETCAACGGRGQILDGLDDMGHSW